MAEIIIVKIEMWQNGNEVSNCIKLTHVYILKIGVVHFGSLICEFPKC